MPKKVVELNAAAWTPKHTLERAIDMAEEIENLAITMKMKDGSLQTMVTTNLDMGDFALICKNLEIRFESLLVMSHYDDDLE